MAAAIQASRDDPRRRRLNAIFYKFLAGERKISDKPSAKLCIEAICDREDPVNCVEKLISSPSGLSNLQQALFIDVGSTSLNDSVTAILSYFQASSLRAICGGQYLEQLATTMVDPPIFWNAFVKAHKSGSLSEAATDVFAWLLLLLISLPAEQATKYHEVGNDRAVQAAIENARNPKTRSLGQKIKHILDTSLSPNGACEDNGPGGRHDNDFADIQNISIVPTPDELSSTELPFLRRAVDVDEVPKHTRLAVQKDNQFRLVRENLLREVREEIQIALGKQKGRRKALTVQPLFLEGCNCGDPPRSLHWTIRLRCRFDIPQMAKLDPQDRVKFVKENWKFLSHQSMACLLADGEIVALVTIQRDQSLLAEKPPAICVQLPNGDTSKALLRLKFANVVSLVQLNTALFAVEPVLKQLQSLRQLALVDEIMLWEPGSRLKSPPIRSLPKVDAIVSAIEGNPQQDLQHKMKLPSATKLDASQARCLLAGLNQRLSLVQGPPGTGKSFIGALLAKIFNDHSSEKILVVCYTNHALDQFLSDLLKIGIPREDIVRLGAAHKSTPQIKALGMFESSKNTRLSSDAYKVINRLQDEITEQAQRLQNAYNRYNNVVITYKDLLEHIEFEVEDTDFLPALTIPEEDEGMTRVGKGGRAVQKFYLIERWSSGQNAGVYRNLQNKYPVVWEMKGPARQALLTRWRADILKEYTEELSDIAKQYSAMIERKARLFTQSNETFICAKRIIGCTTTAAAKYAQEIRSASPGILLVEEAGEILESHILTALGPDTKHLVLIGDHKQLRPKADYHLSVERGNGYDLNRSLFERLVLKDYPHQVLSQQHRMRPSISTLVRQLTYPDLVDAESTKNRPHLRGFQDDLVFITHDHPEDAAADEPDWKAMTASSSRKNRFEADMILKCVRYLGQQGYGTDDIVVLTPYLGQLHLLSDVLSKDNDPVLNDLDSYDLVKAGLIPAATARQNKRRINIATIDNYQGQESDVVVVSLTRSNAMHDVGFMSTPERVNVLLSRARNGLILVGNASTFKLSKKGGKMWTQLVSLLAEGHHLYDGFPVKCERHPDRKIMLRSATDFDAECPDGGCLEPCDAILNCGTHKCPSKCHQLSDHSRMPCEHLMSGTCQKGHQLSWKCHQKKPSICRSCDREAKEQERQQRAAFERQQKLAAEQAQHDAEMAKIENELRAVREEKLEHQRAAEMNRALEQRRQDLEVAKLAATQDPLPRRPIVPKVAERTKAEPGIEPSTQSGASVPKTTHEPVVIPLVERSATELEWDRQKRVEGAVNVAIDDLMKMTGLEKVKAQVLRIKAKIETSQRQDTDLKQERFGICLLGNPGTGKTTVARLYAKFLTSMGVLPGASFVETSGSRLANEGVSGAKKHIENILAAGGGAFFLDEAYQLTEGHNPGGTAVLDFLLAEIENNVGKIVFMLAGYNRQMESFFKHNPGYASRIPYSLQFADYEDPELLHMLGQLIDRKYNGQMKLVDGPRGLYARIVIRRLGRGRGVEGFGNARALQNVSARISERQAARLHRERIAGQHPDDFLFTVEDLIGPEPSNALAKSVAWRDIQSMIGLKTVKESLQAMVDRIQLNYLRELKEKQPVEVSYNRVFTGSPGTGKTSVGKLYGQVLAELGLLSTAEVITKNPADFKGAHVGQSEETTKAILAATIGKVLIIDEAYMLHSGDSNTGSGVDPYNKAIVDTIVAEVQSTPGEDRCVLLLGYKHQMEEFFQKTNPGLARRFPLSDAFDFEDFNDDQLRQILELKLRKQDLSATKEAKEVAMNVLIRAKHLPNFGNAGEIENLLSHAKSAHQTRHSKQPSDQRPWEIMFEPMDFDAEHDRELRASENIAELFKDDVGRDDVIAQLGGYQKVATGMKAKHIDPRSHIPFTFVFKGPPGTGKTTTARKLGQVFYDMGFLSKAEVVECSVTDLVGSYIGHTGPKTVKMLDKSLGKVLFIDEAYRLGEGHFAGEAISELVDSLTKPQYLNKLVVILAGYEQEMNSLLSVNSGLMSRFSTDVVFRHMTPDHCLDLLLRRLSAVGISVIGDADKQVALDIFHDLAALPFWGNGRDIDNLAKMVSATVFKSVTHESAELIVSAAEIADVLREMHKERVARSKLRERSDTARQGPDGLRMPPPQLLGQQRSTARSASAKTAQIQAKDDTADAEKAFDKRDDGVAGEVWKQLELDKQAAEQAEQQLSRDLITQARAIANAKTEEQAADKTLEQLNDAESKIDGEVDEDAKAKRDARIDEQKRLREQARLKKAAAILAREEAERERERIKGEDERKAAEERKVQSKLREMGTCPVGFRWIKQAAGYRCAGGSHFVSNGQLDIR